MKAGGIGNTPNTPSVFCAVSAVTAVMAKPSSIVTVLMSAWMPAPPPESEPAMISTRPFIRILWASLSRPHRRFDFLGSLRHSEYRGADLVADAGQQRLVLALRHDPDHRLGPRIADYQPSLRAEPRFGGGNRALDAGGFERPSMAEANIAQQLRHRLKHPAHLTGLPPGFDNRRQHLQRRDQAVAGRRIIAQVDVNGPPAAE